MRGQVKKVNKPKKDLSFFLITVVIGFMIAIQYQTIKSPAERDSRDIWQIREALLKEKELQSALLREIRSNDEKLASYESKKTQSKELTLRKTIQELKTAVGLTDVTGPGIILKISPVMEEIKLGEPVSQVVSPDLLKKLLNELNMYDAKYVSIDGVRMINTTVIRDINKETTIDGHTLKSLPIEVKVVTENMAVAEKLYNRMQGSQSVEEFFLDNLRLSISKPIEHLTIPAYDRPITIRDLEMVKGDKGGKS